MKVKYIFQSKFIQRRIGEVIFVLFMLLILYMIYSSGSAGVNFMAEKEFKVGEKCWNKRFNEKVKILGIDYDKQILIVKGELEGEHFESLKNLEKIPEEGPMVTHIVEESKPAEKPHKITKKMKERCIKDIDKIVDKL